MSDTPAGVGTWILNLVTPIGELDPVVVLNADGTGQISHDLGAMDVLEVAYDGDDVRFSVKVVMPMGEFELTVTATVAGDSLTGVLQGEVGTFPVTGIRKS